jgi:hypothetical protein
MASPTKAEFDVLANDKASTKLDKIANAFHDLGEKAKALGGKASEGLSKMGSGVTKAAGGIAKIAGPALLGAGVAAGAIFIGGLTQAMDVQDANAKLTAGLGLTKAESAKVGKISGDLYKNAYGESVAEVGDVLATVFQSGLASTKDAEASIKGVTAQVMNYSKISNEEALPVTRAVSQMLKTGLAKNATEAFDILTRGQQLGINKSEDLLDTFNEYGTQFRKIGLDGPMALGLMNQALQAGARDSDTAADALKEFAIRAVDGSKTTVDGFQSLKLNAKSMQEQMASGGPKAAAGLDTVLDRLRAVKDPAERSRIAVELFGTKAEDLGDALFAMDTSTAVSGLGNLQGAAERAGEALGDTASNKLATVGRTIKMSIVDAIGKYALPKLEEFADWFNGPGKFVLVSWALSGASAILGLADKMLGGIEAMIGGLAKFGKVAMIAAAGAVAVFNPGMAIQMLKNADALGEWADQAKEGIGNARGELQGWKDTLDKTNTKVKLQADIADLDAKLAKAQKELKDPGLTKERKAKLTADIAQLTAQKNKALGTTLLGDPKLTATKVAKLTADKQSLENQIAAAKKALADPKLTAEKRAKLNATIDALQRAVNAAQAKIDTLKGKTVYLTSITRNQTADQGGRVPGKFAAGGDVKAGVPVIVGDGGREELFVPGVDGTIAPSVPKAWNPGGGRGSAGGGPLVIELRAGDSSAYTAFLLQELRKAIRIQFGGDVQVALGKRR